MTWTSHPRALLTLVCSAQFLVVLDMSVVSVALPELRAELGMSASTGHWVMTAYAVTFGGFLLVGGRTADAFGRRRALVVGAALFTVASLVCGIAPSGAVLIVARAAQGIGGALLSTAAFGMLVSTFEVGRARTRAIAAWGSAGSLGAVAGFVAGGALTEIFGWRAIFIASVPVGSVLLMAGRALLPDSRSEAVISIDVAGATFVTAGVAGVAFVVTSGALVGWTSLPVLAVATGAVGALATFVRRELRSRQPLVPSSLVRDRSFAVAGLVGISYGSSVLAILTLLALYLQVGRGLSALETGAVLLLLRVPAVAWARFAGRAVGRFGPRIFLVIGTALMSLGLLMLSRLPGQGPMALTLVPALLALGIAIPTLGVSVSATALGGVHPDDAAVGSGLLTSFQWVGGALGFAVVSAVAGLSDADDGDALEIVGSVHAGFLASAALCAVAGAVAAAKLLRPRTAAAVAPS